MSTSLIVPLGTGASIYYDLFNANFLNNYFESDAGQVGVEGFLGGTLFAAICSVLNGHSISIPMLKKWMQVGLWAGMSAAITQVVMDQLGFDEFPILPALAGALGANYGYTGKMDFWKIMPYAD